MAVEHLVPSDMEHAADLVRQGKLVAFPTDTVYGVAALADEVMGSEALREFKWGRRTPFALHAPDVETAMQAVPDMTLVETRAVEILTPRGVTVVAKGTGMRVVTHEIGAEFLRRIGQPVVATSANEPGSPALHKVGDVLKVVGIDAVLDAGDLPERPSSTVAGVLTCGLQVLREGALPLEELRQLFTRSIEFICLGNLNRSAMAHHLLAAIQDELDAHHGTFVPAFLPSSSGIIGHPQSHVPEEMVEAAADLHFGATFAAHVPRKFDPALSKEKEILVSMGPDVIDSIRGGLPGVGLLEWDVQDPMGGPPIGYRDTAEQIVRLVRDELLGLHEEDQLFDELELP